MTHVHMFADVHLLLQHLQETSEKALEANARLRDQLVKKDALIAELEKGREGLMEELAKKDTLIKVGDTLLKFGDTRIAELEQDARITALEKLAQRPHVHAGWTQPRTCIERKPVANLVASEITADERKLAVRSDAARRELELDAVQRNYAERGEELDAVQIKLAEREVELAVAQATIAIKEQFFVDVHKIAYGNEENDIARVLATGTGSILEKLSSDELGLRDTISTLKLEVLNHTSCRWARIERGS